MRRQTKPRAGHGVWVPRVPPSDAEMKGVAMPDVRQFAVSIMVLVMTAITSGSLDARANPPQAGIVLAQMVPAPADGPEAGAGGATEATPLRTVAPPAGENAVTDGVGGYRYDPSGRRDPFASLLRLGGGKEGENTSLPPLQRVGVTELALIGIIWGGFGYTAMVQTPDGKGYAVRRGTRIGTSNGVVTKVTENEVVVTERFTDLFGKEQERQFVKLLHTKEEFE